MFLVRQNNGIFVATLNGVSCATLCFCYFNTYTDISKFNHFLAYATFDATLHCTNTIANCYICNIILQVIQRNVTWNITLIWFMRWMIWFVAMAITKSSNWILRIRCYLETCMLNLYSHNHHFDLLFRIILCPNHKF